MARKLSSFDFSQKSTITPPDSSRRYPWDEWLDGDIWELTFGEDFDMHPLMMERIIRTRSTNRKAGGHHRAATGGHQGARGDDARGAQPQTP